MSIETPFRVAHLSDPHLTSLAGASWRSLVNKRVLGYLSWRRRRRNLHRRSVLDEVMADVHATRPDQILITGDLTHVGLPSECEEAARWLDTVAEPARLCLVPGNHDRYARAPWADTVGRWQRYLGPEAVSWPRVERRDGLCIVRLDCSLPTLPFMATGTLGAAQIAGLAAALRQAEQEGLFRLVMLHHSPLPRGHAWRKRLTDAKSLMRVIDGEGAELVVHGHGHAERLDRIPRAGGGDCVVIAVPSASHVGNGRAGWNEYAISGAPGDWFIGVTARRRLDGRMVTREQRELRIASQ